MRLKQYREDVKDLRLMADAHVQDISKRYQRLIVFAEDAIDFEESCFELSDETKRVLKDSEGRGE